MSVEKHLNVRSAHDWDGFATAEEAVSACQSDLEATQKIPVVSASIGQEIIDIDFANTWLSLIFNENQRLTISIEDQRIVTCHDDLLATETSQTKDRKLRLKYLPTAYLPNGLNYEWDRQECLNDRIGQEFRGLQLSKGVAFLYVSRREVLMLTVLEVVEDDGRRWPLLKWGDAC